MHSESCSWNDMLDSLYRIFTQGMHASTCLPFFFFHAWICRDQHIKTMMNVREHCTVAFTCKLSIVCKESRLAWKHVNSKALTACIEKDGLVRAEKRQHRSNSAITSDCLQKQSLKISQASIGSRAGQIYREYLKRIILKMKYSTFRGETFWCEGKWHCELLMKHNPSLA